MSYLCWITRLDRADAQRSKSQAVLKEATRLHPGVSYPLERVVPPGGVEVCGHYLPEGTIVGMHAWVIHREPSIFGSDADQFKPERWLQSDNAKVKRMESALLTVSPKIFPFS